MQWLAYPIQKPGTKLYSAVFVYSQQNGVGKNFLVDPFLKHIYGNNWNLVNGTKLQETFNGWASEKQFILLDEVYMPMRSDRKTVMSDLRSIITNETFVRNAKYEPERVTDNYANLYLGSNHSDALQMEIDDRRMFVIHAPEDRLAESFYSALHKYAQEGGAAQVLNHLLNEVDCAAFNPQGHAPRTEARKVCLQHVSDNNAYLVQQLAEDPSKLFSVDGKMPDKELWTTEELSKVLNMHATRIGMSQLTCSPQGLSMYLHHRGGFPVRAIKLRIFGRSTTVNLYAILDSDRWADRENSDWVLHYKLTDSLRRFDKEVANVALLKTGER
jgi:hypothetical protein